MEQKWLIFAEPDLWEQWTVIVDSECFVCFEYFIEFMAKYATRDILYRIDVTRRSKQPIQLYSFVSYMRMPELH